VDCSGDLIVLQGGIDGGGTVVIDQRPDSPREPLVHVFDCECKFALYHSKKFLSLKSTTLPFTSIGCFIAVVTFLRFESAERLYRRK
jgi:hypothetical protein